MRYESRGQECGRGGSINVESLAYRLDLKS